MMNVGFDAKRLFNNFTGLGNYSRTVVYGLNEQFPDNNYYLFTPKIQDKPDTQGFLTAPYHIVQPRKKGNAYWRSLGCIRDIRKHKLDIYHGLSHELPIGIRKSGAKSLVTIHDLIYKTYPRDFSGFDRAIYDVKFKYACTHAHKVIAVSQSTKNDLEQIYNLDPAKIEVVYQSCMPNFKVMLSAEQRATVLEKHGLPANFMLYVGSIIERKNLLSIVQALKLLSPNKILPLVVVGKGGEYEARVKKYVFENKLDKQVIFTSSISFLDLPALYQQASLFIYPSFYEGFGIPIIEALWSGTPVITSNISSLPEAAGPGAYYCEPSNAHTIAEGIQKILNNDSFSKDLIDQGFNHVQQFESKINAQKLMQIYQKLLAE